MLSALSWWTERKLEVTCGVCKICFKDRRHLSWKEERNQWSKQCIDKMFPLLIETPSFSVYKVGLGTCEESEVKWWLTPVSSNLELSCADGNPMLAACAEGNVGKGLSFL